MGGGRESSYGQRSCATLAVLPSSSHATLGCATIINDDDDDDDDDGDDEEEVQIVQMGAN